MKKPLRFNIIVMAFGLVCANIQAFALLPLGASVWHAFIDAFLLALLLCFWALVLSTPILYFQPRTKQWLQFVALAVLLAFISIWINDWLLKELLQAPESYLLLMENTTLLRVFYALCFLLSALLGRRILKLFEEQATWQNRFKQNQELARKTELRSLREQLHPHFLFNTLNSISALIVSQPKKAREMVLQLSHFLRQSIQQKELNKRSLKEELDYLAIYLDIEKVRFGNRLQCRIECGNDALEAQIPSFVLQPLVENAVKYGLYDTTEEVEIIVKASLEKKMLKLSVANPFDEKTVDGVKGTGFGHGSVRRRLNLIYGRADLFFVTQDHQNYVAHLKIPQE